MGNVQTGLPVQELLFISETGKDLGKQQE